MARQYLEIITNYKQYTRPASKYWPDQMTGDMIEPASKASSVHWKGKTFMKYPHFCQYQYL